MADVLGLHTVKSLDPRMDVRGFDTFAMGQGGASVNYRRQTSNSSSGNNSNLQFNPVINTTSVLDRRIMTELNFNLKFSGTAGTNGKLLSEGNDAVRSLGAIVSNMQIKINNESITEQPEYVNHWLAHFSEKSDMNTNLSLAPYMGFYDQTQSYEESAGTFWNPLGGFNYSSPLQSGRGMYEIQVVSNNAEDAEVNLVLFDYIYLSPMVYGGTMLYEGIPNISDFSVTYNFTKLPKIWSHSNDGGAAITDLQVQIGQGFLNYTEITPPADVALPKRVVLPYNQREQRVTNANVTIQPGQTGRLFSNTYTLNTVPSKCVLFAKEREADFNSLESLINKPDVYGGIKRINIQFANTSNLFANCNQQQLYQISTENGVVSSIESWSGKTIQYDDTVQGYKRVGLHGSIFCFDFGRNIGVTNPSLLTGVASNVDFQVESVEIENTSSRPITYDLYVFFVYESAIEIELGRSRIFSSMVLPTEAMRAPHESVEESSGGLRGSSFKGMLSSFFKGLVRNPVVRAVASSTADQLLQSPERDMLRKYTGIGVVGAGIVGSGKALVKKNRLVDRM